MNPQAEIAIAELRATPQKIVEMTSDISSDTLRNRPFENKWTPLEILGHLVDHEIASAYRSRVFRVEANPVVTGYDQEAWVERQNHNSRDPDELRNTFSILREMNLAHYASISDSELAISKVRSDDVAITMGDFISRHAGHDRGHLDQLDRYLTAITSKESG